MTAISNDYTNFYEKKKICSGWKALHRGRPSVFFAKNAKKYEKNAKKSIYKAKKGMFGGDFEKGVKNRTKIKGIFIVASIPLGKGHQLLH